MSSTARVPAFVRRLAGRAERVRYALAIRAPLFEPDRLSLGPVLERHRGLDLFVPPTVLSPGIFRTGLLLADAAATSVERGDRLLDMGTGSGVVAIRAAQRGARVSAVDLNPAAVAAARVNAMLNRVEIDVRQGDLFEPLDRGAEFEWVLFNPPFFARQSEGPLALALGGGPELAALGRFLERVRDHRARGGRILIAGSTLGALDRMRAMYTAHRFRWRTERQKERISERLIVDSLEG